MQVKLLIKKSTLWYSYLLEKTY